MTCRAALLVAVALAALGARAAAGALTFDNPVLTVTVDGGDGSLAVLDKRTGETYRQAPAGVTVRAAEGDHLDFTVGSLAVRATFRLDPEKPELVVELAAPGPLATPLRYPGPFLTRAGDSLIVPLNEGISYPVDDPSLPPMSLVAYGGHGICMAFWGAMNAAGAGPMTILETPDDACLKIDRNDGRLVTAPSWEAQKGQFGTPRRLRYVFFDKGGHVAMAKRYRAYARETGLFKTLEEKRRANPNVDLLVGAVNVWCWDKDSVSLVREMQAAGIDRILWSNGQSPENLRALNALGVLTSRYDIYQDVMDPAKFPLIRYVSDEWPTAAWPDDVVRDAHGDFVPGWKIEGKDGEMYPCGVVNDQRVLSYARERIPADLAGHPYRCRFIDTTTASGWREDYDPRHPMTRSDCRRYRMELLGYVSGECGLVTGSETGHDAAVPVVDYFEGMLSLTAYRVPDAGRRMQEVLAEVPEKVAKFQVGQAYRLPLWELVYHDCVVAHWYWGDYSNKLPAIWDKRDLFNVLYGTAPMFMFTRDSWKANRARFVQSYRATAPVARATGYSEMTDHRFLTPDRDVQQTAFADGTVVTVNFGAAPYALSGGGTVAPGGFLVGRAPGN